MDSPIKQLFANLDKWRHLPSYQLERRADAFFGVYLPLYFKYQLDYDIDAVIPEFPVRVGTVFPETNSNKSFKIDYLFKTAKSNQVLFVELKTDDESMRPEQDEYLEKAKERGMRELVLGVRQIIAATNSKQKYSCLWQYLADANIVEQDFAISIFYVKPTAASEKNVVTFSELAEFVASYKDELSQRFAQSLYEWAKIKAGQAL